MTTEPAATQRVRAYQLMEASQTADHHGVRPELAALEASCLAAGDLETALLAATGVVLHDLVHGTDRDALDRSVGQLVERATTIGAPTLLAAAVAMRAVTAGGDARLLPDAGHAVALVENDALPALDRCFVWMMAAAAYNSINLWELADELYDRVQALAPECEHPCQQNAVAINRFLIRLEWAAAHFERGATAEALLLVRQAAEAARRALESPDLPGRWRLDALACRDLLGMVEVAFGDGAAAELDERLARVTAHRADLVESEDVEVLPFLDSFTALALRALGRHEEARAWLSRPFAVSQSTGARTFWTWVRAEVAAEPGDGESEAVAATASYAALVCELRWSARTGGLGAARAHIAEQLLTVRNAALAREVLLDPLTGLQNRRAFDAWLAQEPAEPMPGEPADPGPVPTALLLIDVDRFKSVNDEHGHLVGDEALRRVATVLSSHVRVGDIALRLGGDEFAVVLQASDARPGTDAALLRAAHERANALTHAVAAEDWESVSPGLSVQVTIGVATGWLGGASSGAAHRLYRLADADLYAGKARVSARLGSRSA